MSTDTDSPNGQSTAALMGGILSDLQHLVDQQFHLIRQEIENDARRYTRAAVIGAVGVGGLLTSLIMASVSLSQWLHWSTSPTSIDSASLPLWACYAVVAAILAPGGALLLWMGLKQMKRQASIKGLPPHDALDVQP